MILLVLVGAAVFLLLNLPPLLKTKDSGGLAVFTALFIISFIIFACLSLNKTLPTPTDLFLKLF